MFRTGSKLISVLAGMRVSGFTKKGFTFIEVMLTVVILSIGIIGVIRAYIFSLDALGVSQVYIDAVSLAQDKMIEVKQVEIENGGLAQGKSEGAFQGRYDGFNWELEVGASDIKGLNTVKVTVFKQKANPSRKFTLVSYVENKK